MEIFFLDDSFPREAKNKLFKLEEIINNKIKNKSYKFTYDSMTNEIEIFVRFPHDICIKHKYRLEEFVHIPVDILYKNIEVNLFGELEKIYFINKEEE